MIVFIFSYLNNASFNNVSKSNNTLTSFNNFYNSNNILTSFCNGSDVINSIVLGNNYNETDFTSSYNDSNHTFSNCSVFLNASNNNLTLSGNYTVNGRLLILGNYVSIYGNINATNLTVNSNCLNFNGNIYTSSYAQFFGNSSNCTSYFNGTLNIVTPSAPLIFNGNTYSVLFNFQGPLSFNGATLNSTNPGKTNNTIDAIMALNASSIDINDSNFNVLTILKNSTFNSLNPIIMAGNSNASKVNFYPCVYSPDNSFSASNNCIPIYLYGSLTSNNLPLPTGSLYLNGLVDSNDNSIADWYSGLNHVYNNVLSNGQLNLTVFVPQVTFTSIAFLSLTFSTSNPFDCSQGSYCTKYFIPVITK
ncbi:MAG: hypothetical protein M1594_01215 [Candidatus Marsarchaeota archaeon]|nr:hypothetical protein [Candidatus Marsarchaeota archaeon]